MNQALNTTDPGTSRSALAKPKRSKRKMSGQYIAFLIHSFFGLKVTLILTLVLASGTVAVIAHELDWLLIPQMRVTPGEVRLGEGVLMDKLQAAYPDKGLSSFQPNLNYPHTAASAIFNDDSGGFRNAWINPYTGEVHRDTSVPSIGMFLGFLHGSLFLPVVGRMVVNAFGIFTMISLIAGLIAVPKFWRYFLRVPRTNNLRAFLSDFHKIIGVWSIWFVLIMGVTGTWWFYHMPLVSHAGAPTVVDPYARKPLLEYADLEKFGTTTPTALSAKQIVAVVKREFPNFKIINLTQPSHNADPYEVSGSTGEWLVGAAANRIWLNPYDGSIIGTAMVADNTAMQRFDQAMGPLHYGNWAVSGTSDLFVKFIWFLFGAFMTALAVTGLIINYKRTKRSARIVAKRSPRMQKLIKSWQVIRPWGGPMGIFKYLNVAMLAGVGFGTGVVLTISSQGVENVGYEYTSKPLGPWDIKVNAFAGFLEKDLDPIRAGTFTNFAVSLPNEAYESIKFIYARIGKPRTVRAPGTLISGPIGMKQAGITLPNKLRDNAELWITAVTWTGDVHQVNWPLMPDGKETIDVR